MGASELLLTTGETGNNLCVTCHSHMISGHAPTASLSPARCTRIRTPRRHSHGTLHLRTARRHLCRSGLLRPLRRLPGQATQLVVRRLRDSPSKSTAFPIAPSPTGLSTFFKAVDRVTDLIEHARTEGVEIIEGTPEAQDELGDDLRGHRRQDPLRHRLLVARIQYGRQTVHVPRPCRRGRQILAHVHRTRLPRLPRCAARRRKGRPQDRPDP